VSLLARIASRARRRLKPPLGPAGEADDRRPCVRLRRLKPPLGSAAEAAETWTALQRQGRLASSLAAALLLFAAPLAAQCPDGTPPPCRGARAAAAPASIAVLYFDNVTRDTGEAYLAEGLTEELIARLGQLGRLDVKSRTAVRRFRGGAATDPIRIGRQLGVAYLVSGSVRRAGTRLRVTAELMRVAGTMRVWGETYERATSDLMEVEEDIAAAIASGIGGRLAPAERRTLVERPTTVAAAYDRYLRGNYLVAQRSAAPMRRAIAEYEAAVRVDSGFARAWARIALAYGLYYRWAWPWPGMTPESLLVRGEAAAERALRLDTMAADAWLARGTIARYRQPVTFTGVMPALQRALALDSRNAEAWHMYGIARLYAGDDSGAVAAYLRALALEHDRPITWEHLANLRRAQRRPDEARQLLDSSLAADSQAFFVRAERGLLAFDGGDTLSARRELAALEALGSAEAALQIEPLRAALEARRGDTVAARGRLGRLAAQLADPNDPGDEAGPIMAEAYLRIGDTATALDWLERVRPRGGYLHFGLRFPVFDAVRSDPRFQRLVAESRPPGVAR
jgi:TolB-like protein/Tfp pilus assembly protein PilF